MILVVYDHDVEIAARTVYGEARGESYSGKLAVCWTIRNRTENPNWWGRSVAEVCLKPKQFSCWDDHNRIKMLQVGLGDPIFADCMRATLEVVMGTALDLTLGADHYHAMSIRPAWAKDERLTAIVGNHKFYKLRGEPWA